MEFQDFDDLGNRRQGNCDHPVHTAGTDDGVIEQIRMIASADDDDAACLGEIVECLAHIGPFGGPLTLLAKPRPLI